MLTITLAYCTDDQTAAHQIAGDLSSHVELEHVPVGKANEGPLLADLLRDVDNTVVVLISDDFLTNPNCMLNAHDLFGGQKDVLLVYVKGRRYDELSDEVIATNTSLNNQSEVMHYVNHWQDRYIDLRTQAEELSLSGGEAFQNYLRKIRETSTQAEELLYLLKDKWSLTAEQFSANHYQQLFLFTDRPKLYEEFKSFSEEPVDLSGIPGLEMLGATQDLGAAAGAVESDEEQGEDQEESEFEPDTVSDELSATVLPISGKEAEVLPIEGEDNEHPVITQADDLSADEQAASWISRAWTMFDSGEGASGLDLLSAGREALPEHPGLQYQQALLLVTATGDVDLARQELEDLLNRFPEHSDALFLAGELAEASGEYAKARDYWEELSDNEPFYPDLNLRLGILLDDHFPNDFLDASAYLRRASKDEEAQADVFYRYGRLLGNSLGRKKKAIRQLRRAVELSPGLAPAHFELARMLHLRGELDAARNSFLTASRLDPDLDTEENRTQFAGATTASPEELADDHQALLDLQAKVSALEEELNRQNLALLEPDPAPAPAPREGDGKTVLISGATSGIGQATARRLAAAGYRLILLGRRAERLDALSLELEEDHGVETFSIRVDVRHREEVRMAIANLPEDWKTIDVLLNNAGKAKGFDPIHTGNYDHWDEMIDVNLKGLLTLTREVSPLMVARQTGMIINVASTAGKEVYPKGNVYCATKHAVDALTYAMRLDLVEHGIRVGQICPAHVEETEFAVVRFDGDTERAKIYNDFQPLRSPDVAEAIHFMISRPAHVNLMDIVLQGTQQASSTVVDRSGRAKFAPEEE